MIAAIVFHLWILVIPLDGQPRSVDLGAAGSHAECWASASRFIASPVPSGWRLGMVACVAEGTKA